MHPAMRVRRHLAEQRATGVPFPLAWQRTIAALELPAGEEHWLETLDDCIEGFPALLRARGTDAGREGVDHARHH